MLDLNAEIVVFAFWGRGQISSRKQTSYAKKMGEAIYSVKRKKKGSGSKDNCVFQLEMNKVLCESSDKTWTGSGWVACRSLSMI